MGFNGSTSKRLDAMPSNRKCPDNLAVTEQWHAQRGAHPPKTDRRRRCVFGICGNIADVNDTFFQRDAPDDATAVHRKHVSSTREKFA